jgi:mono/diheme cytochrome c family protein
MRSKYILLSAILPLAVLGVEAFAQQAPRKQTAPPAPVKPAAPATTGQLTFEKHVAPLIGKHCLSCHGKQNPAAAISLVGYKNATAVLKGRAVWEKVSRNVSAGHMPPPGSPPMTQAERDIVVGWIDATLSQADCNLDDPGRVTMRRLNREEYNNTVRDLIGLDLRPADDFPSDDVGYGFDNIGDVLTISPLLMDKYLAAAEKIAQTAIVAPETRTKPARFPGSRLDGTGGGDFETGGRLLGTEREEAWVDYPFVREGEYLVRIGGFAQQAGPEPARMGVRLDGKEVRVFEVKAVQNAPEIYSFKIRIPAGKHRVSIGFLNNYKKPDLPPPNDRNLIVDFVEIQGPIEAPGTLPASHKHIISVPHTRANRMVVARKVLGDFARRAFRRPVTKTELDRLVRYVVLAEKQGESWERGIQLGVQAVLVSPSFLFRVETNADTKKPATKNPLGSYELASRLSYFLWSSMPDDQLLALAAKDALQDPAVLAAQAQRMLKDPKAKALTENFAGQWLQLRKLNVITPDPVRFPNFNEPLRKAMRTETEMFFQSVVENDRSILDFIDGQFTYLNETLAKHYGIPGVTGDNFRKVALVGDQRRGILTHGSILTVTSNPTRTSPVKRGKWVLEQILGTPPPPPPPGVAELPDDKKEPLKGTLRQRLEQHRSNPTCASCHSRLDPIGFGFENFDAVGAWRDKDGEFPVDSSGTLTDGKSFQGPAELAAILKTKKPLFTRSFSEKMLTYALGRGIEPADRCHVDEIAAAVAAKDYRFSALVTAIVQSDPFRLRRGDTVRQAKK